MTDYSTDLDIIEFSLQTLLGGSVVSVFYHHTSTFVSTGLNFTHPPLLLKIQIMTINRIMYVYFQMFPEHINLAARRAILVK